jgi:hypothetical protein
MYLETEKNKKFNFSQSDQKNGSASDDFFDNFKFNIFF